MTVDGVQQKQTSPLVPALLLGGATTAAVRFAPVKAFQVAPKLEKLEQDKFEAAVKDFTGEDKAAADTVLAHLKKQPTEAPKKEEPKAEAKAEAPKTDAKAAPAATEVARKQEDAYLKSKVEYIFGKDKTEVSSRTVLEGLTPETFKKGIDIAEKEVNEGTKGISEINKSIAEVQTLISKAQADLGEQEAFAKQELVKQSPAEKKAAIKLQEDKNKAAAELTEAQQKLEEAKPYKSESDIAKLQEEVNNKQAAYDKLDDLLKPEWKKAADKAAKEATEAKKEADEAKKAAEEARKEAITAKHKKTEDATFRNDRATELEIEAAKKDAMSKYLDEVAKEKAIADPAARVKAAKERILALKKDAETGKQIIKESEAILQEKTMRLNTQKAKLELATEAGEDGKVTRESFLARVTKGVEDAKTEVKSITEGGSSKASAISEKVVEAFKKIADKLPREASWKKAGLIGGAVAIGTFIIASLMGGNKSQES